MPLADAALILPAGGKSSRLGTPKGLVKLNGKPWFEHQCESYCEAGGTTVILVLGYDHEEYRLALEIDSSGEYQQARAGGCSVVVIQNPLPELGPFTSLQAACRWILHSSQFNTAFFLPVDTPLTSGSFLNKMLNKLEPHVWAVEPRIGKRGGHPVLLNHDFIQSIAGLDPRDADSRLDYQMITSRSASRVVSIQTLDDQVGMNLNDMAAWQQFSNMH
jgi:CTP:molybdopterin cytidylyltransferase MocA